MMRIWVVCLGGDGVMLEIENGSGEIVELMVFFREREGSILF